MISHSCVIKCFREEDICRAEEDWMNSHALRPANGHNRALCKCEWLSTYICKDCALPRKADTRVQLLGFMSATRHARRGA